MMSFRGLFCLVTYVLASPQFKGSPKEQVTTPSEEPMSLTVFYGKILLVFGLLCVAAIMSGLTIGLMSLDVNNLMILSRSGDEEQKRLSSKVLPIRKQGYPNTVIYSHLLLCTLLIGNMLANETSMNDYNHSTNCFG